MNADPLDEALRNAEPLGQETLDRREVHDAISALLAQTRASGEVAREDEYSLADLLPFTRAVQPGAEPTVEPAPRRRRRTAIRTAIATSAILAVGTGVAAASGFLDLHTGAFGKPGMTENDTSEYLNSASPQIAQLMRSYVGETPLAPGYSADPLIEHYMSGENHIVQAAGLRAVVFSWSSCSWELTWLDAHASGDASSQAAATDVLNQIPDWPVVPLVDADGRLTTTVHQIAEAATAGDPGPIERDTALNCDGIAR